MGNGMNKIVPGLYVGNFRDAKDQNQLQDNKITHILAIHDNAAKLHQDKEYLCIVASDSAEQDLVPFFQECIEFIHKARLNGGAVLVHCLAGVSRSVTITAAYLMTVTNLGWRDSLNAIRGARSCANPNYGFQRQLQRYENTKLPQERKRMKSDYPHSTFKDEDDCLDNLAKFQRFVLNGEDDGLYNLPYDAFRTRQRPQGIVEVDADKEEELGAVGDVHDSASSEEVIDADQEKLE